jgi:integrase
MREKYQPEDLEALFCAFNPEKKLRYLFFVLTGQRGKEVRDPSWSDIDFNRKCVWGTAKKELRIKPKDKEKREILMPASVVEALRDYKSRQTGFSRDDLTFTASEGRLTAVRM